MLWIEIEGQRTDVTSVTEAETIIRSIFPDAVFLEPIRVNRQHITHVRRPCVQTASDLELMPVALIVEEMVS